ncbi:hypothetical protein [Halomarina oriensis]|uniref:DUF8142 domain-containing protein n=1 Tax=Halomarina oriensis TaxID=671145 RepID=A0A6B0GXR9_9EURY|nr:hypothetical protein [Halomarina oriensis]MWG36935.1 hypothetical protein [Halomarina oriensis]
MATEFTISRKLAALYISPFVLLGLADIALLLLWGLDPLWGFMILPPILFISVIGWIAFRTGFARDRGRADGPDEASVDASTTEETAVEEELV